MATSLTDDLRRAMRANGSALHRLILYNVAVYVVLVVLGAVLGLSGLSWLYEALKSWLMLPSALLTLLTRPWTVFTYAFTHESFFHILFNMLNLYWFGQLLVEYLGARRLVSVYVLGALAGAAAFVLAMNLIPVLVMRFGYPPILGASGAVSAIIVAAATLLPDYTFMLILLGPVRIKWIAAVLVLLSVSGLTGDNAGGQFAHLGGALLGFTFVKQLQAGRDLGAPLYRAWRWLTSLFTPVPVMRATSSARGTATAVPTPTADEAAIDRILDKINRSGYDSLSKEEKQQLFQASKK
ncbi:MAG: rhomboid family intramembrane serine protease [Hymenobacteraceae bacterium]|nr:rhomboid family intramembrane serine protease [Hymenobacteraceae bacterium]